MRHFKTFIFMVLAACLLAANVSAREPVDVTRTYITNPQTNSSDGGWVSSYNNFGPVNFRSNTCRGINDATQGWVELCQYFEVWQGGGLSDGRVYQVIQNLPAGQYELGCDAYAIGSGVYLFSESGGQILSRTAISCPTSSDLADAGYSHTFQPVHYSTTFDVSTTTDVTIGIMAENVEYAELFWASNFTLTDLGTYFAPTKGVTDMTSLISNPQMTGIYNEHIPSWSISTRYFNISETQDVYGQTDATQDWVSIGTLRTRISQYEALDDGTVSQVLEQLPAGTYLLACSAFAGGVNIASPAPMGVYLFADAGNQGAVRTQVSSPILDNYETQPVRCYVRFTVNYPTDVTIGIQAEAANVPDVLVSDFKLYKLTSLSQSSAFLELAEAVARAKDIDIEGIRAENTLKSAFAATVTAADQALVDFESNGANNLTEAKAQYDAAKSALFNSKYEYDKVDEQYNFVDKIVWKIVDQWNVLANALMEAAQGRKDDRDNGTLSTASISNYENELYAFLHNFAAQSGNIKAGDDLTTLMRNWDFEQHDANNSKVVPGWTISQGTVSDWPAWGNVEAWHNTFNINQTLPNMPAGVYQLSVQAYSNNRSKVPQAQLYANDNTTTVKNVYEEYSSIALSQHDEESNNSATGAPTYTPRDPESAYWYFSTNNDMNGQPYYTNKLAFNMQEAGNITLGLRTESGDEYVHWDNFSLQYLGTTTAAYKAMLEQHEATLQNIAYDAEWNRYYITSEGLDIKQAAISAADLALRDGDEDAVLDATDQVLEAIEYIEEGQNLLEQLREKWSYYNSLAASIMEPAMPGEDPQGFASTLEDISTRLSYPYLFADNNAIVDMMNSMEGEWRSYVLENAEGSSTISEPTDLTMFIVNPNYYDEYNNELSTVGWEYDVKPAIIPDVTNYYEYWNKDFDIHQTINGLPAGYYILGLKGFYRPGLPQDVALDYNAGIEKTSAFMYAKTNGDKEYATPLCNIMAGALSEEPKDVGYNSTMMVSLVDDEGTQDLYYIPNNLSAVDGFYKTVTPGLSKIYRNSLYVYVGQGESLTIGVRNKSHIDGDWETFTGWTLRYVGQEKPARFGLSNIKGDLDGNGSLGPGDVTTLINMILDKE